MALGAIIVFMVAITETVGGSSQANRCINDWDALSVKFPNRMNLPITIEQAVEQGWVKKDARSCKDHSYFVGKRWELPGSEMPYILFGENNKLAGIQSVFPNTIEVPKHYKEMFQEENTRYHLTAYFTQPENICWDKAPSERHCIGNSLYIQVGSNKNHVLKVPLLQQNLKNTNWVIGHCFNGMGTHYWYNVTSYMKYEDFLPVFLLYNDGRLNGFGWAVKGNTPGNMSYEHPPAYAIELFFRDATLPRFMIQLRHRTTQHFFMQSDIKKYNTCSMLGMFKHYRGN
ncbi:uncharacterized protein LOC135695330 [Rhopilema esculentum]|uniref:uncharacterized protein LOC135695330 n=1 Tax=Rhopilema esculentum TaxID=499914 RepID=UPI0031D5247F